MANSGGDYSVQNFQDLINNYEQTLTEITLELNTVQNEHKSIREMLSENAELSAKLNSVMTKDTNESQFHDAELIDNLKMQLAMALSEKDHAIELWQNATKHVDQLEDELRAYQSNTEGLVPKSKVHELKVLYETKMRKLEETLAQTKKLLKDTVLLKTKELKLRDREFIGSLESRDNTMKMVKNLEDEVLVLQQRLSEADKYKSVMEKKSKLKEDEIDRLRRKTHECRLKVEEALQVVEAALNEKDAALLREAEAKQEILRLSKSLTELIEASEQKIKTEVNQTKVNYDAKVERLTNELKEACEKTRIRSIEMENMLRKCQILEQEVDKYRNPGTFPTEGNASKLLMLEKNFESTFQKLLLSERENIRLQSERDSIKSDLDQMALHFERDVKAREAEKAALKLEVKKLRGELFEIELRFKQSEEAMSKLRENLLTMESSSKTEIEETHKTLVAKTSELADFTLMHNKLVEELQEQLKLHVDINKRWRTTTNQITTKFEHKINDFKVETNKVKMANKHLGEKLKSANEKIAEYRKFLELISKDVNKIATIPCSINNEIY